MKKAKKKPEPKPLMPVTIRYYGAGKSHAGGKHIRPGD